MFSCNKVQNSVRVVKITPANPPATVIMMGMKLLMREEDHGHETGIANCDFFDVLYNM